MSGELVLITGGAGFIGRQLAHHLVSRGMRVRALDALTPQVHRDPERSVSEFPGEVMVGDVRDEDQVRRAMTGVSRVAHLAAETGVGQSMYEKDRYYTVNVEGTSTVLRSALTMGGLPVLVASSRAVYGQGAYECSEHGREFGKHCRAAVPAASRETDEMAPVSVYGETKVLAENAAGEFAANGLPLVIVRPQNVIGAGQAPHNPYTGVLAAFSARLRQGLAPQIYGDGLQTRDFVAVEDLAAAMAWLLVEDEMRPDELALNFGSGVRVTLRDLALASCAAADASPELEYLTVSRPGDIEHACADMERARRRGLPLPVVDYRAGVQAFMDYAAGQEPVDPSIWDAALQRATTSEST